MAKSRINNLKELLSNAIGAETKILEQNISILTAPGEHYGSIMLALDLVIQKNGKEEALKLVAKLIPANEMLRLAFDIPVTFKKEVTAYTVTIPALVKFQKEFNVPEDNLIDNLFPKCFGARVCLDENKNQVDEDGVLIFENLKVQGYQTEDRLVGFGLEATKIIIRDLAKFHAVPIALKLLKPEVFKACVLPAVAQNKGLEQLPEAVGLAFHKCILEKAQEIPDLEPYLSRIKEIVDDAVENPYVNRPPPSEPWGTMSHSDFWTSNTMLLKDSNGNPIKNKIVDLQIMLYASAVRDLVFFLFTSVINEVLDENINDFLKLYHEAFTSVLNDFNIDLAPFSWKAYLQELDEVAPTEVYHILVMLKPICTERGKVNNTLENFQDSDWSRHDLIGPNHKRKLRSTVLSLAKMNWL